AAPIERTLMAGDELTGMTIMRVTAGLDSGPMALQTAMPLGAEDCFEQVSWRLAELGGELAIEALDLLERELLEFADQDEELATYAEKISPEERRLDPSRPAAELERAVCALNPHIGTHLELEGGGRLGVRQARLVPEAPGPGLIEVVDGKLVLGTAAGGLRLETLQPPGRSPMAAEEFLRGHPPPARAV
ncbi:MAG: methionyl-tRNA formyltransferase, partial [Actinomycetota bacterium]|nr:methionyl-tRNA formyltransferase [Actinomycetota bacterium]